MFSIIQAIKPTVINSSGEVSIPQGGSVEQNPPFPSSEIPLLKRATSLSSQSGVNSERYKITVDSSKGTFPSKIETSISSPQLGEQKFSEDEPPKDDPTGVEIEEVESHSGNSDEPALPQTNTPSDSDSSNSFGDQTDTGNAEAVDESVSSVLETTIQSSRKEEPSTVSDTQLSIVPYESKVQGETLIFKIPDEDLRKPLSTILFKNIRLILQRMPSFNITPSQPLEQSLSNISSLVSKLIETTTNTMFVDSLQQDIPSSSSQRAIGGPYFEGVPAITDSGDAGVDANATDLSRTEITAPVKAQNLSESDGQGIAEVIFSALPFNEISDNSLTAESAIGSSKHSTNDTSSEGDEDSPSPSNTQDSDRRASESTASDSAGSNSSTLSSDTGTKQNPLTDSNEDIPMAINSTNNSNEGRDDTPAGKSKDNKFIAFFRGIGGSIQKAWRSFLKLFRKEGNKN